VQASTASTTTRTDADTVEVSQLVDEVDRIASARPVQRHEMLTGRFGA